VLFDGGPGTPPRGGRAGLDARCETARAALGLAQTVTHAFITVSDLDSIARFPETFPDLPAFNRIVGPTGIRIANSFADLIDGQIEQSMVCAGVVADSVKSWLSGSPYACKVEPTGQQCGQFGGPQLTCEGWTLDDSFGTDVQAQHGLTTSVRAAWFSAAVENLPFLRVSCAESDNILCIAYTP